MNNSTKNNDIDFENTPNLIEELTRVSVDLVDILNTISDFKVDAKDSRFNVLKNYARHGLRSLIGAISLLDIDYADKINDECGIDLTKK